MQRTEIKIRRSTQSRVNRAVLQSSCNRWDFTGEEGNTVSFAHTCQSDNRSEIILPLNSKDALSRIRCLLKLLCDPYSFLSPFLVLVSAPSARAAAGRAVAAPSVVLPVGSAPRRWEPAFSSQALWQHLCLVFCLLFSSSMQAASLQQSSRR